MWLATNKIMKQNSLLIIGFMFLISEKCHATYFKKITILSNNNFFCRASYACLCRAFSFSWFLSSVYYISRESCLYMHEKREWEWEGWHWQTEREGSSVRWHATLDRPSPSLFLSSSHSTCAHLLTLLPSSLSFVSFYNRSDVAGKDFWPGLIAPEMKYHPFSTLAGERRSICEK